jgi:acyl dehydratase
MENLAFGTLADARAMIGRTTFPVTGDLAVNTTTIWQFCAMSEDGNPAYWDRDVAEECWGGLVSPPGLLVTWGLPLMWKPTGAEPHFLLATQVPLPGTTVINSSIEMEYFAPLYEGARLTMTEELVEVSEEKTARVGRGHFLTTRSTFRLDEDVVGIMTNVLFRFTPAGVSS